MMHDDRVWSVSAVESAEDLARKLTEVTWCGCTAFELENYLWLNDATSPDGAQEFAVLKKCDDGTFVQIESITFSWCDYDSYGELAIMFSWRADPSVPAVLSVWNSA